MTTEEEVSESWLRHVPWLQSFTNANAALLHRVQHIAHLAYFALVAAGGPYYWAAGLCFALGMIAWCLHIEGVE